MTLNLLLYNLSMLENYPQPFIFYDTSKNQVHQFYFSPETLLSQARTQIQLSSHLTNFHYIYEGFIQDQSGESMMTLSSILTNQMICIYTNEIQELKQQKNQIQEKFQIKFKNQNMLSKLLQKLQCQWICPISQQPMVDPVTTSDGFTYQRKNIQDWLSKSNLSPMTKLVLESKTLYPNRALKNLHKLIKDGIEAKMIKSKAEQDQIQKYMSYNMNHGKLVYQTLIQLHEQLQQFYKSKIEKSFNEKKNDKSPLDRLQQLICKQDKHISLLNEISNDFNKKQELKKRILFSPIYKDHQPYQQIQNQQGYEEYEEYDYQMSQQEESSAQMGQQKEQNAQNKQVDNSLDSYMMQVNVLQKMQQIK